MLVILDSKATGENACDRDGMPGAHRNQSSTQRNGHTAYRWICCFVCSKPVCALYVEPRPRDHRDDRWPRPWCALSSAGALRCGSSCATASRRSGLQAATGIGYTSFCPAVFTTGLLAQRAAIRDRNEPLGSSTHGRNALIDPGDVADAAAAVLTGPWVHLWSEVEDALPTVLGRSDSVPCHPTNCAPRSSSSAARGSAVELTGQSQRTLVESLRTFAPA